MGSRVLYSSLFVVVLPLTLVCWATVLDRSVHWPVPRWPAFSVAVIVGGGALMLTSMLQLYIQGRGLPMSAYPPTELVTRGAYGLYRHPIYLGAAMLCLGSAVLSGSSSGLYVVTPVFIAAMVAYVCGYEQPGLDDRFGAAVRGYQPLLSLPRATHLKASWSRKAALALAVFVPWLLVGYLIDYARHTPTYPGAFAALFDGQYERSWSLLIWMVPYLVLALRLLVSGTDEELRHAAIGGFTATLVGSYLYGVLPGLGFEVRSGGWQLDVTSLAVCVAALYCRRVWEALRSLSEKVANSRRDWLLVGGRFRIINHAVYSGLAGATGVAVGGSVLGNGMAALALVSFMLIGAAVFAQLLWGNTALLRPFGYWGAVLGAAVGGVAVHLAFGVSLVTVALSCAMGAPFAQAIGRLRCLAQGCCHGIETGPELGIRVWQSQSRVVALSGLKGRYILITQLYSSIFNSALGLLLLSLYLSGGVDSALIIGLYLILTGIERFAEDSYRGEKQTRWAGALRENQWIAIAALILGMVMTLLRSAPPTAPVGVLEPSIILAMVLAGLVAALAMSMDFPKATMRYSRLSGQPPRWSADPCGGGYRAVSDHSPTTLTRSPAACAAREGAVMSFPGDGGPQISDKGQGMHAGAPISGRRPEPAPAPVSRVDGKEDGRPPDADLSLRAPHFPVSLEKWYIDVLLADGTVLLVYVGTLALCGRRLNRVTAELFRPGAATVRGSARVGALVGGPGFLRGAAASIEGERVRFNTDGLSGDLVYRARLAPWRPMEPFLSVGRRTLIWSVEIPDADVEGRLSWPGGSTEVRGRGYRDRVWFDVLPWRFPISRLEWGRAAAGAHAAVWTRATTAQGVVAGAWMDGRAVDVRPDEAAPVGVGLGPPRVLLDSDVADLEGLRLGPLRRPVGWLSGAPHETKWQAPCVIADDPGVAVHEVVTWHGALV